jgi:hypothetical protein
MVSLSVHAYRLSTKVIKLSVIGLLAVILALPSGVWAKPTTAAQARSVVANWIGLEAAPLGAALGVAQSRQVLDVKTYTH